MPGAPTPHPAGIALSALVGPLGIEGAQAALVVVAYLALGSAATAVAVEARALAGWAAAILAALLVVLAPVIATQAREGLIDVPYVALVAGAVAMVIRQDSSIRPALVLLAAAGCIRPEAWAFAFALVLWRGRDDRLAWALAAAGPVRPGSAPT